MTKNQHIKLNMKLIILLQFIEELFVSRADDLIKNKSFHDTMVIFMFLLDKLGILTFDMPDQAV